MTRRVPRPHFVASLPPSPSFHLLSPFAKVVRVLPLNKLNFFPKAKSLLSRGGVGIHTPGVKFRRGHEVL